MAKCDFRFHRFLTSPKTTPRAAPTFPVKPALGYGIDFAGHSVVLSGDTRFSNNLIQFSQKGDLLIHEVIDPDGFRKKNPSISPERFQAIVGHHTTAQQAGTVFAASEAEARGLLTHRAWGLHRVFNSHTCQGWPYVPREIS